MPKKRTKISHDLLLKLGFENTDWFYDKYIGAERFSIGLFLLGKVDMFYKSNSLYNIELIYIDELEYFYEKMTKHKLEATLQRKVIIEKIIKPKKSYRFKHKINNI